MSKIFTRVSDSATKKVFSFRNLVNIYYDTCILNRYLDPVVQELIT